MATTQDVSVGNFIRYNGELVQVIEWQHRTPGNLRAFYQGKMRRVKDGKSAENRFRSGESVEIVRVEVKELAYLTGMAMLLFAWITKPTIKSRLPNLCLVKVLNS